MKGIVFTEFLEMIELEHGYKMVDDILSEDGLDSGGIYTSVGTYQHSEMIELLIRVNRRLGTPIPDLLKTFGKYLFHTFYKNYPSFFESAPNAFAFLESIENYIHIEVRKLYPDAELPTFETQMHNDATLEMIYRSNRKMSDFAEGLIEQTLVHYKEPAQITKELIEEDGSVVRFIIEKVADDRSRSA